MAYANSTESLSVRKSDFAADSQDAASSCRLDSHRWPPNRSIELLELDLSESAPELPKAFFCELARLGQLIDEEWGASKSANSDTAQFNKPITVAEVMRRAANHLPNARDRELARIWTDGLLHGLDHSGLDRFGQEDVDVAIVAAPLATWFGKDRALRPSAFACRVDRGLLQTIETLARGDSLTGYVASLRAGLSIKPGPTFVPSRVFFMAGEGNLHPKHIAYFLPEDAGVKNSPYKKTYYFSNTHRRLLQGISYPLFDQLVDLGIPRIDSQLQNEVLPALGVYGHELGHCVARDSTVFTCLNKANRWISVALQEICADVLGTLIVAERWSDGLGITPQQAVTYYLAECLRYVHRGLGYFPDSDGMLFQLSYLCDVGALELCDTGGGPCLKGDAGAVIAGLRSLARVLADTALDDRSEDAIKLFRRYGPSGHSLRALVDRLTDGPVRTVEYVAKYITSAASETLVDPRRSVASTAQSSPANYYTTPRELSGRTVSIYQIWEGGGAYNDSVTPATYSNEYRSHIALKMERLTSTNGSIFSIGCGNAAIEGLLHKRGRKVSGIDCNEEAVELALQKGVDAICGDFTKMPSGALMSFELVYADGLAGHLCDAATGLKPFLDAIHRAGLSTGAKLLISNDAPRAPRVGLEPHSSVASFWLISHGHLADQLNRVGFKVVESYTFPYHRPISGLRDRSICIAERL